MYSSGNISIKVSGKELVGSYCKAGDGSGDYGIYFSDREPIYVTKDNFENMHSNIPAYDSHTGEKIKFNKNQL